MSSSRSERRRGIVAVTLAVAVSFALPAVAAPDDVPDLGPGLSEPLDRGNLIVTEVADVPPTPKVIDGVIDDWVGSPVRLSGNSHYDAGEFLHTDFLFDARGADDGGDVDRWEQFAGLFYEETRANRLDDLLRTSGSQLGVPDPIGASDEYGDSGDLSIGDLTDVRIAADDANVTVLVRTTNMTDPDDLVVLLLADTVADAGMPADPSLGLPDAHRFDVALPVSTGPVGAPDGVTVAADATGWTNAVEIAVPVGMLASEGVLDLSVMTAGVADDGALVPLNIAFRHAEPVDIWNDRLQAFALHGDAPEGSSIDLFSSGAIDLADLRDGRTQAVRPGPGYHERHVDSGDNISSESGMNGRSQPYGIQVPTDFDPAVETPLTFWLHYRGGKAHSGAAINPRMIREYAREDPSGIGLSAGTGNLVVTPHARGTSFWYVSRSHQDFFEVYDDVHDLFSNVDPTRRYLSGYSMGGYGTYLLGALYPDLFAAGNSVSGALTQGAWTGVMDGEQCQVSDGETGLCYIEANGGDAAAQLSYRVLDNFRNLPVHIDHGTNDELVPVTGVQLQAARLVELGYRVEMQTFDGYEHFTQAAVDEFYDGAAYLERFRTNPNPRQVTYRVVPALVHALNNVRLDEGQEPFTFDPDGAYWVDDIVVRDADIDDPRTSGIVDVVAEPLAQAPYTTVPVAGAVSPGHSSPFIRTGLDWVPAPDGETAISNAITATLTGVEAVTLDGARMELRRDVDLAATLTTDGPATVVLTGIEEGDATLRCDCGATSVPAWDAGSVALPLTEAGTWTFAAPAIEAEEPTTPPTEGTPPPSGEPTEEPDAQESDPAQPSASDDPSPAPSERARVTRIDGDDRVATALAISRELPSADVVLLARADDYPDALTGAPLAFQSRAPILLTDPARLSPGVLDEIARLGATEVVVLGGPAAVTDDVVTTLRRTDRSVRRIAGDTRFDTAALVADELDATTSAWVVEGANADPNRGWPDAVAVAPVAARAGTPILLTRQGDLPPATSAALTRLGTMTVTIAGGTVAVSDAVFAALDATTDATRIAGADRYDTALRVAASLPSTTGTTWLATGRDYPDALAAGPVVALRGDRLLLVDGIDPIVAGRVVDTLDVGTDVKILGGARAISSSVLALVERRVR